MPAKCEMFDWGHFSAFHTQQSLRLGEHGAKLGG